MKRVATVVLALALVGGIGFAGWKIWDNRQENKNSSSQQSSDPSEGGKYMVIKEWGLRLRLGDQIRDSYYEYKNNNAVVLHSPKVEVIKGCKNWPLAAIERAKKGESLGSVYADDSEVAQGHQIKIADYYYLNTGPGDSCTDPGDLEGSSLIGDITRALGDAFETLEEVNR